MTWLIQNIYSEKNIRAENFKILFTVMRNYVQKNALTCIYVCLRTLTCSYVHLRKLKRTYVNFNAPFRVFTYT